jgi:RNA recognition motif-containing protein
MGERGMGMGYDGIFMSYHESYSDYTKLVDWFRQFKFLEVGEIRSFIVNLEDEIRYHPLDFSTLANHLTTKKEEKE